jgi:hypothetical protein
MERLMGRKEELTRKVSRWRGEVVDINAKLRAIPTSSTPSGRGSEWEALDSRRKSLRGWITEAERELATIERERRERRDR